MSSRVLGVAAWVDKLANIPPLTEHVAALKKELPAYLVKCAGIAFDNDDVELLFYKNHGAEFPTWALAMRIVGSWTPNSAAAERVFSHLKAMFGEQQMLALQDMSSSTTSARSVELPGSTDGPDGYHCCHMSRCTHVKFRKICLFGSSGGHLDFMRFQ